MKFVEVEDRLIAIHGHLAAVWKKKAREWVMLPTAGVTKAMFEGQTLTPELAQSEFPSADLSTVPDLESMEQPPMGSDKSRALDLLEAKLDEDAK